MLHSPLSARSKARLGKFSLIAQLGASFVPSLGFSPCKKLNVKGISIFLFFV